MLNQVGFQGNLVRDPEFAQTRGDSDIVNFTVASTRKYKDKEDTAFVDCTAYGQTATNIAKFFSKGSPIIVQGRLSQSQWEDRDGNKRSKIYITVDAFHFAGSTDGGSSGGGRGGRSSGRGKSGGRGRSRDDRGRDDDRGRSYDDRDSRGGGRQQYDDDIPF